MSASTPALDDLLASFDDLQRQIGSYELALDLMTYDAQTIGTPAGAPDAGIAQGVLYAAKHRLASSDTTGELLEALEAHAAAGELDDLHAAELRSFARTFREERLLPADLIADYRHLVTESFAVWRAAKEANDFARFAPYLDRVFASLRAQAACLNPGAHPYDVLLDRWQRGNSMAECDRFFSQVKATVAPLAQEIARQPQRSFAFASAEVPVAVQQDLALDLARAIGLDTDRLVMGLTEHPCSYDMMRNDTRIAHHYLPTNLLEGVATTCHEGGHVLYMQNVDPIYSFTCLHGGVEAGIHESQSRLMENNVGRSRAFMPVLLDLLRKHVPAVYADVDAPTLYQACNVVRPSLIRTQADELTYPLHIMVRYECEKLLMSGSVCAADVPTLWHDLMRDYLGVEVPDDTRGCLQDMHWASDYVGYFTGYALGNAYAAQFMHHARAAYEGTAGAPGEASQPSEAPQPARPGALDEAVSRGDLTPVTGWLSEHVWRHGKRYDPQELIAQACGEPFDPAYYTRYLVEKFSDLYGLA